MTLENIIMTDLKEAMKAKDQVALRSIRAIKAAILLAKTDCSGKEVDETTETKILQKLVKQRQDSLNIYEKQDREDLASVEREEIDVIKKYLPEQMGEEDLKTFLTAIISKTGAEGMKDMGKVMGIANQQLAGKADGKTIASFVRELLT